MSIRKTRTKAGKLRYSPRVHVGGGRYKMLGTYATRDKARKVKAEWEVRRQAQRTRSCGELVDRWLEGYRSRVKASSYDTAATALKRFKRDFGSRSLASLDETEAEDWVRQNEWAAQPVVTMLNAAVDRGLIPRNHFRGLARKGPGRKHNVPLTVAEVDHLAEIAGAKHGPTMRAFITFTAYTGMRVGEVFALEWGDIDFERSRIMVSRRLYRGELDLPKGNRRREIVLPPPARDALLPLDRTTEWVFPAKRGGRMSQSGLSYYWQGIVGAFGRPVEPHELRHFCGHHLYVTLRRPARVVAEQLAHSGPRQVEDLYGHGDVGALEEIERAFESNVVPLREVSGE